MAATLPTRTDRAVQALLIRGRPSFWIVRAETTNAPVRC